MLILLHLNDVAESQKACTETQKACTDSSATIISPDQKWEGACIPERDLFLTSMMSPEITLLTHKHTSLAAA